MYLSMKLLLLSMRKLSRAKPNRMVFRKYLLIDEVTSADCTCSLGDARASKFSWRFEADFIDGEARPVAEFRFKYRDFGKYLIFHFEYY